MEGTVIAIDILQNAIQPYVTRSWLGVVKTVDGRYHAFSPDLLYRNGTTWNRVMVGCNVWRGEDGGISWRPL